MNRPLDTNNWVVLQKTGYHIRALAPFKNFRGLDIPWEDTNELEEVTEQVVKSSRSRKVVKLAAGQFRSPVEIYVKRYNFKSWLRRLLRTGRKTRAGEEFDLGWKLLGKGIRTPRPVWLAEEAGHMSRFSLLATEALPYVESALDRWSRCDSESERSELLVAMGQLAGQLHDSGFYHDDLKAGHLLIFPERPSLPQNFYLIDLLGGSFPPFLSHMRRAKNLYQIIRSFIPKRYHLGFTRDHRMIFLKAYSGSKNDADFWSAWVDRIGRVKGRRL